MNQIRFYNGVRVGFLCLIAFQSALGLASISQFTTSTKSAVGTSPPPSALLPIEKSIRKHWGMTYFTFFYGPGLVPHKSSFNPNHFGRPNQDGVYLQNNFSFQWKGLSERFALDFQTQFKVILNNYSENQHFRHFLWESPRVGISGVLLSGREWSLKGAINTNFPYFFPYPFSGYQTRQRTLLMNPGLFAQFQYQPVGSRWSVFSVVSPRFFIYENRNVSESQHRAAGYTSGRQKPEFIFSIIPTLNYQLTARSKLSLGTLIDYRKLVLSSWNPLRGSFQGTGLDPAWRLDGVPLSFGLTYSVDASLSVFPFVCAYPIAAQRVHAESGRRSTFLETASVGMWIYGTLF